jgi:hypothetical protein
MKLRIVAAVLAFSFTAFAQDVKPQTPPSTPPHEHAAKAENPADAKKDCCCKKMMEGKDGMKMDENKSDDKEKKGTKAEKKDCC